MVIHALARHACVMTVVNQKVTTLAQLGRDEVKLYENYCNAIASTVSQSSLEVKKKTRGY